MKKAEGEELWIIITLIIAVIVLILVLVFFSSKLGKGSRTSNTISNNEISAVEGETCHSVIMSDRICVNRESCPDGYAEVHPAKGSWSDCKSGICCQKISS